MPVDPQIQALLDKGSGVPATHTLPVAVARAQYRGHQLGLSRPRTHRPSWLRCVHQRGSRRERCIGSILALNLQELRRIIDGLIAKSLGTGVWAVWN